MSELTCPRSGLFVPALLVGFLTLASCGGPTDPVQAMQKSLASAPEYTIVLEDMREEEGFFPKYYHRYKVMQGNRERVSDWVEVQESIYRKYEPFLGMALVAKSNEGVNDTPHPAGYHYAGNPRYGYWGGGGFWVFYGQYAMMRSLMGWGGRPIYQRDYDDYRNYRGRGRPYYGPNREFGTQGSVTKQRKPGFYERRKRAIARRNRSFSQRVQHRVGRGRTGFGSRRGGFGK